MDFDNQRRMAVGSNREISLITVQLYLPLDVSRLFHVKGDWASNRMGTARNMKMQIYSPNSQCSTSPGVSVAWQESGQ